MLRYISAVLALAQAAAMLPKDFCVQADVKGWLDALTGPLSQLLATAAQDIHGPHLVGEESATDIDAALSGIDPQYRSMVLNAVERIESAATGQEVSAVASLGTEEASRDLAAQAGLDPATWAMIIQFALQLIAALRKENQG